MSPDSTKPWHFYVVRCVDDSLYASVARDPLAELSAHNAGRGAAYTRLKRPVHLALAEAFSKQSDVADRLAAFNRLPKHEKERQVVGERDAGVWRALQLGEPWLDPRSLDDDSPARLSSDERGRV